MASTKRSKPVKLVSITPTFTRCIRITTSAGFIDVKVIGEMAHARDERDVLVDALVAAGAKLDMVLKTDAVAE